MRNRSAMHWVANALARWSGDDVRSQELRTYFDDAAAAGYPVGPADIGSLLIATGRYASLSALKDLPLWIAGLPIALMVAVPWLIGYESHFFAWDMNEEGPISSSATNWKTFVDVLLLLILLQGFAIGRLSVTRILRGNFVWPALSFLALGAVSLQLGRFVGRTPWERDGWLKAEHVDEVPLFSVGLYATYVLLLAILITVERLGRASDLDVFD